MNTNKVILISIALSATLVGCASIKGTVTPLENGSFRSSVFAETKEDALKISESDAKLTCKDEGHKKHVVVSKDVVKIPPDRANTGYNLVDKAINLSQDIARLGNEKENGVKYEVTTLFKCR